ncbi:TPA: hypothetical protein NPP80_005123 [Klebsiella variicola subsp. variicola]|nr:hypothetical protein [Klebsiella variicola subsp. variicola]HCI6830879.1 hypothetical protein [Klebsiella variicola subsp. variicola]HCK0345367.1 hypothetical protein [Klebsiella variicola subsp. variicola]
MSGDAVMRFRYISLTGMITLVVASVILLPGIFSQLRNTPEINYYKSHPDLTYTVFNGCKSDPVNVDECYAAYNAAVYLADSADCSPDGKEIKRRFKRLVEQSKEEYITEEINADCKAKKKKSLFARLIEENKF